MTASDVPRVAELALELAPGLLIEAQVMIARFDRIVAAADQVLLVAEAERVVGWVHGMGCVGGCWLLEVESYAEIQALVVGREARRIGVGRALVEAVLTWARAHGFSRVRVRSNVQRRESHAFYPALCFEPVKTQHNYERKL